MFTEKIAETFKGFVHNLQNLHPQKKINPEYVKAFDAYLKALGPEDPDSNPFVAPTLIERYSKDFARVRILVGFNDRNDPLRPYVERSDCYKLLPNGEIDPRPEDFYPTDGRDWATLVFKKNF